MALDLKVDIGDLMNGLIFLSAAIGLFLNLVQMKRNSNGQRALLLRDLVGQFTDDNDARDAFYAIEYHNFRFREDFLGSDTEKQIDQLLSHCDIVCSFFERGLLDEREMDYFSYYFRRIWTNGEVRRYFEHLENWAGQVGESPSFQAFKRYCRHHINR